MSRPTTLGALKREIAAGRVARRPVRSELRENLLARLKAGGPIFPGVLGYDDTVVPQVVNAILARHHFILLGLRGQAKSRLLRAPGLHVGGREQAQRVGIPGFGLPHPFQDGVPIRFTLT